MSCSPFDLRDYLLGELEGSPERQQVESHVKSCAACREELERLQLTQTALFQLREEEIPQRIAFVSDKVFEPSPVKRWLAGFWGSASRLGFASAALLSAALIVFAAVRPAPAPVPVAAAAGPSAEVIEQRVQAAADKAAREIEARYAAKTEQLVRTIRQQDQQERKLLMASFDVQSEYLQHKLAAAKKENSMLRDNNNSAALRGEEPK